MQSETPIKPAQTRGKPKKRVRMRYSNSFKCLLCYLVCFSLPVLWQLATLRLLYPYKLAATAPAVIENLLSFLPFLQDALSTPLQKSTITAGMLPDAITAALLHRDQLWQLLVLVFFMVAWLVTVVLQLIWRFTNSRGIFTARTIDRAVSRYRLSQFFILLVNAAIAAALWLVGVQFIGGRTYWDYLIYFLAYPLNIIAAFICFRYAASPMISGKRAFFKRL